MPPERPSRARPGGSLREFLRRNLFSKAPRYSLAGSLVEPHSALVERYRGSLQARSLSLFCEDTHIGLRAAVKRGPSDSQSRYFKRVAKVALYCAHRTSTFLSCAFCEQEGHLAASPHLLQSRSFSHQGWGLIDLPLRASNEGSPRPRVARAQKIIRLHPLLCSGSTGPRWVSFQFFFLFE